MTDDFKTILAIYGAVVGTAGFILSLYLAVRDRGRIRIILHSDRLPAEDWGNRDSWYALVSVINHGRRAMTVIDASLEYYELRIQAPLVVRSVTSPSFWTKSDGSRAPYAQFRQENTLVEGGSILLFFEFADDADVLLYRTTVRDATLRRYNRLYSIDRVFDVWQALLKSWLQIAFESTRQLRQRSWWRRSLLLYSPARHAFPLHVIFFSIVVVTAVLIISGVMPTYAQILVAAAGVSASLFIRWMARKADFAEIPHRSDLTKSSDDTHAPA